MRCSGYPSKGARPLSVRRNACLTDVTWHIDRLIWVPEPQR